MCSKSCGDDIEVWRLMYVRYVEHLDCVSSRMGQKKKKKNMAVGQFFVSRSGRMEGFDWFGQLCITVP